MKTGDLIFVSGNSFISKLVKFFDKGKFSHVAIALNDHMILEAIHGEKVRILPFYFERTKCEIVSLDLNISQRKKIKEIAINYTGKDYDTIQAITMAYGNKSIDNAESYICTELVGDILREVGFSIPSKDLAPNKLYAYFKN